MEAKTKPRAMALKAKASEELPWVIDDILYKNSRYIKNEDL